MEDGDTDNKTNTIISGCKQYPAFPDSELKDGFCAFEYPIKVKRPRMILSLGTSDALILERGTRSVVLVRDSDGDGVPDTKKELVTQSDLNHGLQIRDNFIYASSDEIVYRWKYSGDSFDINDEEPTLVINNIDNDGQGGAPEGHTTRTLIFDNQGRLYISVGSASNVDENSFRARIRRFDISDENDYPIDFLSGDVFADGVRNEVGLAFDRFGVLWGVENGADELQRSDLGTDIYNNNPAEELNRFPEELAGEHWGYPFCWSEYSISPDKGRGRGSAWAWPGSVYTDKECAKTEKSALSMQAHSAPLGIVFYDWNEIHPASCSDGSAFPKLMDGYAFIAFHGSWNRDTPTGYKVVYVPIDIDGMVAGEPVDLLAHKSPDAEWESGFRPVDLDFDECGRLVVTSDGSRGRGANMVRIEYGQSINSASVYSPSVFAWSIFITLMCSRWF